MSLIYFDGFNSYAVNSIFTQNWTVSGANINYLFTAGRYTGACLQSSGYFSGPYPYNTQFTYKHQNYLQVSAGVAIKYFPLSLATNISPVLVMSSNSNAALSVYISYNPYGQFYYPTIVNGSGATIATGKPISNYNPSAWHYYELEAQAGVTNGIARFYIDSVPVLTVTNVNTTYNSNLFYNSVTIQGGMWDNSSRVTCFDDFYINNTLTRSDEINVVTLRPSGDTSTIGWTPSSGSTHYTQVNATAYSLSQTANIGTSTNNTDLFEVSNLPSTGIATGGPIKALKPNTIGYKSSFGQANTFQTLKVGSNTINQQTFAPYEGQSNSSFFPSTIYESNPFTNTSWTLSDINGIQSGVVMNVLENVKFSISNGSITNSSTSTRVTSGVTAPTLSGDTLIFTGTEQIRFTDSSDFHVTAPYSVEMEFYVSSLSNSPMLFNIGQGNGIGFPEFVVQLFNTGQINLYTASANSAAAQVARMLVPPGTVKLNTWYRIGFMVYTYSGSLRVRGYFNGAQMFDDSLVQPWNSPNGLAIVGDNVGYPTVFLNGGIRNLSVAKSLFWPIGIPNYSNVVYSIINGQITGGGTPISGDTPPTVSGNDLVFDGSQRIRYADSPNFRATPPYSVEFEFKADSVSATQILFNIGGDLITEFPELMININASAGLMFFTNADNINPNQSAVFAANGTLQTNTWYKVGLMIYNSGGTRARGYFNDVQAFDISINPPRDSTNGSSFGASLGTGAYLDGSLRNLRIGQSVFWPI